MTDKNADVIIFSKDRPWQLGQLLRTIKRHTDFDNIHILLKLQDQYEENYNTLMSSFKDNVFFHIEKDSFKNEFYKIFDLCRDTVTFMVDDVVFFDTFSAKKSITFMDNNPIFAYQFKMNSTYNYCQTAGSKQKIPASMKKVEDHWVWKEKDGTWDWDYPFDLTGSIYIKEDLHKILEHIKDQNIKNPNYLEMSGADFCQNNSLEKFGKPFMACQENRVCACLGLNHVNPHKQPTWSVNKECALSNFNNNVFNRFDYDEKYFRKYKQRSVHITEYKLKPST